MSISTCVTKLGEPDLARGMDVCGQPCTYLTATQAQEAGRGQYSGWYHSDAEHDATHWPFPRKEL